MTVLAVLQPGYLPWLGFFDQMDRADVFVYYDDVQFDKHGWRNRNRVKTRRGGQWLTVPVLHKGRFDQCISDVKIDARAPWPRKHLATLQQAYARAPYLGRYLPELEAILQQSWTRLADLDIAVAALMCGWLGLERTTVRSSELEIGGDPSERLANLCQHFGSDRYLSGDLARDYLDVASLESRGISVEWQDYHHPVYPQLHGTFVSHLSALDLILNVGPDSMAVIRSGCLDWDRESGTKGLSGAAS